MKLRLSLIGILLFSVLTFVSSKEYYKRHVVLVVDQTPKTSRGGYLVPMGKDLKSFLSGSTPSSRTSGPDAFSFDPKTDCLEIFLYGLQGDVRSFDTANGDAYSLLNEARAGVSRDSLFAHTLNYLVHPYKKYHPYGEESHTWNLTYIWNQGLRDVFEQKTSLGSSIEEKGGYGFSAFLPNAVIPFVDRTIPAQEYYIICVSTFQAGTTGMNAAFDVDILGDIYRDNEKARAFNRWLSQFSAPYQVSDWAKFERGSAQDNGVSAIGSQLVMRSAVNTAVNITSNINLSQKKYLGKDYEMGAISISFPKDDRLDIQEVYLTITTNDGRVLCDKTQQFKYDDKKKEFIIDAQELSLEEFSKDDTLDIKFTFLPKYSPDSKVLPYVFLTSRTLSAQEVAYKSAPTYMYIFLFCVLIALIMLVRFIYRKRGKRATCTSKVNIWPISNSRFMDVSDNHVVSQDCWYYQEGSKTKNIEVTGTVRPIYPKFAKRYKLVAEYQIQDIDLNEEFSFRPEGREQNGSLRSSNRWYPLQCDTRGNYTFDVTTYLSEDVLEPDFSSLSHCILRLKVLIRTYFVDSSNKKLTPYQQIERSYPFIVRPAIENSDIWVALDPGTSGSCITYGWGGLPADVNNINLACSQSTDTAGNQILSPIFFSKVQILDHASIFSGGKASEMQVFDSETGQGDFRFGNEAHIHWGRNSFQSIKKLLGYANELEIENGKGVVRRINGHDLAHLLIKGLCREFEKFIATSETVSDNVRDRLLHDGKLASSRAIVAVPNNYTVNKVQAMVDTIKRTNLFKEIHYIYEAEGVMMYYLNLNWANLSKVAKKTFVVFDMGGATINATAFKIEVTTGTNNGNVFTRSINVDTISRVGYTVGGDNIDFALIRIITDIPSIQTALLGIGKSTEDFLRENKKRLILFVQKLKLDYIEKMSSSASLREGNIAKNEETFWTEIFKLANDCKISILESMSEEDRHYLTNSVLSKNPMEKIVMASVKDAISELISEGVCGDVELILSGRSVLYPRIKSTVLQTLKGRGLNVSQWEYKGTGDNSQSGIKMEEVVKTAVARGACWYGMFSKYVRLRHNIVTSTFGYTDMVNNVVKFVPVVSKNTEFNDNGEAEGEVRPMDPTINSVKFLQMLGSNYDAIYSNPEECHKMAELKQVTSADITGNIRTIKIKVDCNGNFTYAIDVAGETLPLVGTCNIVDADITDTNSEAYAFAALSSLDDQLDSNNNQTNQKQKSEILPTSGRKRF